MIIIDSKKDYYDYLVGINGRDTDVVYDRRNSVRIIDSDAFNRDLSYSFSKTINTAYGLFNTKPSKYDVPRTLHKKSFSKFMLKHYGVEKGEEEEYGLLIHCIIEIGLKQFIITVDRYLNESGEIKIEPTIKTIREITTEEKNDRPVVGVYDCNSPIWSKEIKIQDNLFTSYNHKKRDYVNSEIIFSGTWVTGVISPEDAYNAIYNYIMATKDKKIEDNRTDEQKAQSHGFNKESFRNPIRVKDLNKVYKRNKK